MTTLMRREIGEQPAVLGRTLEALAAPVEAVAETFAARGIRTIVTCGRGSSDHVARYASYLLTIHAGLLVADLTPSIVTAYGATPVLPDAALLAISQSGAAEDIRAVAAAARTQGAPVVAITNVADAPLLEVADHALVTPAGPERSVPATKTFTAALATVALLGGALARRARSVGALRPGGLEPAELARLPEAVERVLALEPELAALGARLKGRDRCVVIGRGYNRATASEVALKIQETSYLSAQDYGASDFLHGPVAVVEPGFDVLVIAAPGPTAATVLAVAARARELGARVAAISDGPVDRTEVAAVADVHVHLGTGLAEPLTPIAFAVAGQLVALHLALAEGRSPDVPRALRKVTVTR
ncbi:MAG: SIS domain-containing protein [Chloroflexota bacterium]